MMFSLKKKKKKKRHIVLNSIFFLQNFMMFLMSCIGMFVLLSDVGGFMIEDAKD